MNAHLRRGHEALWHKFFDERTHLVYDIPFTDPAWFPTPEEVAREIPSCAGWGTGMEDCCLDAGLIIDGMVRAHRITGEAIWADKARQLYQGLVSLGTVAGVPGYVARGFAPGRTDVYPNSSTDQYTTYVYGLWSYFHSAIATAPEKKTAARLLVEVARRIEAFHDDLPRRDGRPSIFGDTSAFNPDRAGRLLEFYLAAYDVSGDSHWKDVYRQKVEERDRLRVRQHYGPENWPADRNTHAVIQNQVALHLLYTIEMDEAIKTEYREGLRRTAQSILYRIPTWREILERPLGRFTGPRWRRRFAAFHSEHPDYDPARQDHVKQWHFYRRQDLDGPTTEELARAVPALPSLRHPVESLATALLSEDTAQRQQAAADGWPMLATADWTQVTDARVWASLDLAYWRGVETGLFPVK